MSPEPAKTGLMIAGRAPETSGVGSVGDVAVGATT